MIRLSFLLEPTQGMTTATFADGLRDASKALATLTENVGELRVGVRHPEDPLAGIAEETIDQPFGTVEGAIELSVGDESVDQLCAHASEVARVVDGLFDRDRSALAVGRVHPVVAKSEGQVFLSLAFARFPGTSVDEFRSWWLDQHSAVAVRLLGPELLGYEQVHVDRHASQRACSSAAIAYRPFDAYDSLTWGSVQSFLASVAKPGGREEMYADEMGHIDHSTYRGALMGLVGSPSAVSRIVPSDAADRPSGQ
ncbi:MAG: hypothetical protein JWO37_3776 [Acidimicrobiales bacterium]|jgi:hypothetical protein|nr:hypothetical protein [Acidimicrobiales bacterium]